MAAIAAAAVFGVAAVAIVVSRSGRIQRILLSATAASSSSLSARVRPEFVLFGDSITQQSFGPGSGWGAAVADVYQRTADVKLRGYSGYNTRWALQLLPELFPARHVGGTTPSLVTIFFGANDANLPGPLRYQPASASRQHVPLNEYVENLRKIIMAIRATGKGSKDGCRGASSSRHLRAMEMAGMRTASRRMRQTTSRTVSQIATLRPRRVRRRVRAARRRDRTPVPICTQPCRLVPIPSCSDGLHPNAEGGKVIGTAVLGAIASHFPELKPASFFDPDPAKLPLDFPDHKSIDIGDLEGSFAAHEERKRK